MDVSSAAEDVTWHPMGKAFPGFMSSSNHYFLSVVLLFYLLKGVLPALTSVLYSAFLFMFSYSIWLLDISRT